MAENPTVDEPTKEQKPTATPESAAKDIINKLQDLGIDSPEKIDGMATASKEAGNLANQLGEARQMISDLQTQVGNINKPAPQTEYNEYEQGVDLGSAIRKELNTFWNDQQNKQTQAQQAYLKTMNDIRTDADYKLVENIWNEHVANPQTQMAVQSGQVNIKDEYGKLVRTFYRESLKQSKTALEGLVKPTAAPHMESGETHSTPLPSVDEDRKQRISNLIDPAKGFEGTDENIKALVKSYFPEDDPILEPG